MPKKKEILKELVKNNHSLKMYEACQEANKDIKKEKKLKQKYYESLNKFISKIKKAIKRIIIAMQEKMLYLIETKYITTKKIIFKAYYTDSGEFWYLTKIYDKNYVEVVKVFDEAIKHKLLQYET